MRRWRIRRRRSLSACFRPRWTVRGTCTEYARTWAWSWISSCCFRRYRRCWGPLVSRTMRQRMLRWTGWRTTVVDGACQP
ncbi:hypothetical protein Naga_103275g1 [Nannochloropsis gaditana]|uniref:Uncharacterized protein n=1 Tax=Nannochloropsis gaditana TaxID=72520 RepID=W7T8S7_9STRA|nr:hypothetical protein Naga_103275g1 [Nannochloropsis gaditana]